jgi:putative ABC transport system ATP-binding protein
MTALENVETPLLYAGEYRPRARAVAALERVGLAERMHHQPNELSGGQRQRVAIARALVTVPSMLLADEPTGALDTRTGEEIIGLFNQLNAEGVTVIIVTHEPTIAERCRRVISLRDGKILDDRPGKGAAARAAEPAETR